MFVLSFIRGLYRAFGVDASPTAIALGIAFGCVAGSVPLTSRAGILFVLLIAVVRVQARAAILAWGLMRLASLAGFSALFNAVGHSVLYAEGLRGFWVWFLNLPVVAWLELEREAILGGILLGGAVGALLFVPIRYSVIAYRRWAEDRLKQSKFFKWLVNFWVIRILRFVFVG